MSKVRITRPNPSKGASIGVAGVPFTDGSAVIDTVTQRPVLEFARRHGYHITDASEAPADTGRAPDGDPAKWTVAQLRAYAKQHNLDVPSGAVKTDVLALVTAHQAEAAPTQPDGDPSGDEPSGEATGD